jgi:hypothetical protein
MAEMQSSNANLMSPRDMPNNRENPAVHPAWLRLMDFCTKLGHGEIEKLKIQDGLPMAAEVTTRKIKFGA